MFRLVVGHKDGGQRDAQEANRADQRERGAPAEQLSRPSGERRAEQGGDGEAEHDAADRLGASARARHAGGDQRRDAEIGAVRQAADEAQADQHREARRQAAGNIAEAEDRHQQQEEMAAREFGAEHREDGRADHDAERVGADDAARLRHSDGEAVGDARQKPHGGELAGADRETADGERSLGGAGAGKRNRRRWLDGHEGFLGFGIAEAAETPPLIGASMPGPRSAINGEIRNVIAKSSQIRDVVRRPRSRAFPSATARPTVWAHTGRAK